MTYDPKKVLAIAEAEVGYLEKKSNADLDDKTANAGLEVEYSELGNPLFRQSDLAFECRILYREELKEELLPPEIRKIYAEGDPAMHTMYIGEIVNVYVKEQEQ